MIKGEASAIGWNVRWAEGSPVLGGSLALTAGAAHTAALPSCPFTSREQRVARPRMPQVLQRPVPGMLL